MNKCPPGESAACVDQTNKRDARATQMSSFRVLTFQKFRLQVIVAQHMVNMHEILKTR